MGTAKRKRAPSQRIAQGKKKKATGSNVATESSATTKRNTAAAKNTTTAKNTTASKNTTTAKNTKTKNNTTTKKNTATRSDTTTGSSVASGSTSKADENQSEPPLQRIKRGIDAIFEEFLTFVNSKGGMHSKAARTAS